MLLQLLVLLQLLLQLLLLSVRRALSGAPQLRGVACQQLIVAAPRTRTPISDFINGEPLTSAILHCRALDPQSQVLGTSLDTRG